MSQVTDAAAAPLAPTGPAFALTLDNCDREPIRIPGSIQPHGALLAFDPGTGTVLHASENLGRWLSVGSLPARGRALVDLIGEPANASVLLALAQVAATGAGGVIRHQVVELPARPAAGQSAALSAAVHVHRGVCIVEVEPATPTEAHADWMQPFGDTIDALRSAGDLDDLLERAAQRIKHLTGFDRVMVYRFDPDWHGHVVADAHEPGMESYYDLHYPASDIPAQARELYLSNLVRYIADVSYTPVPVLPWLDVQRQQPLDMSHATLRSVSPIHVQYLRNMGVGATLTISLLVDGRLWGLVACHHRRPHEVPMRLRRACHALSVTAGYMVGWHEQRARASAIAARAQAQTRIVVAFNQVQADLSDVIEQCGASLTRIAGARTGAFWRNDAVWPFGQWPGGDEGKAVVTFARESLERSAVDLFHTDRSTLTGPVESPTGGASGVMAIRLEPFANSGIVWIRPEMHREVTWGGDPDKPVQVTLDAEGRPVLSPRSSFARWLSVVKGRSAPWTDLDTDAAQSLLALTPVLTVRDSLAQVSLSDRRFRSLVALQSDAYCELDAAGRIVTLSKPLPTGATQTEGRTLVDLLAPCCAAAEIDALTAALGSAQAFRELRMHGRQTSEHAAFVLDLGGEPLKDPGGRIVGWHGTLTDATLEESVQDALRQKEAAQLSNRAKSKFLSQISHELRTPLNAVLGFTQLLQMDTGLAPAQQSKLQHIHRAGLWLLDMIADLLDLSQIEMGHLSLKCEPVDVQAVIDEAIGLVDSQAVACEVRIAAVVPARRAWVVADAARLRQVFVNLASNALKYNHANGEVRFTVTPGDDGALTRIDVSDTGVGLTAEQIAQLFQPFNRLGRESQNIQGTGIGLVIARQLVEAMGGTITVRSQAGQGSTFSVSLAAAAGDAAPAGNRPALAATGAAPADRVVLYVGDDASNVVLVQSIVASLPGVRLVHADSAERALALARTLSPAVVLIDIKLSGLPGMHVFQSIRSDPALQHLRCIAVDAESVDEGLDALESAGFEDRWARPIDLKSISAGLTAALDR